MSSVLPANRWWCKAVAQLRSHGITPLGLRAINLSARVAAHLRQHPELRWDQAVAAIAENDQNEGAHK